MKHLLKFTFLFTVVAFAACRSQKTVEVSNHSANDSCEVQTDLRVHSITNIEKNESIASCFTRDHIEFSEGAGEIRMHPNGEVSIKGLKSASLMRQDTRKQSATTININDSVAAKSQIKSTKATTKATKVNAKIPAASSIWLKIVLVFCLVIIVFISTRYIHKSFSN